MRKTTTKAAQQLDQLLAQIALDHLFIETLATRNSDSLDFQIGRASCRERVSSPV